MLSCDTCGHKPDHKFLPEITLTHDFNYRQLHSFLVDANIYEHIKLYYMINDCLSCS